MRTFNPQQDQANAQAFTDGANDAQVYLNGYKARRDQMIKRGFDIKVLSRDDGLKIAQSQMVKFFSANAYAYDGMDTTDQQKNFVNGFMKAFDGFSF